MNIFDPFLTSTTSTGQTVVTSSAGFIPLDALKFSLLTISRKYRKLLESMIGDMCICTKVNPADIGTNWMPIDSSTVTKSMQGEGFLKFLKGDWLDNRGCRGYQFVP